MINHGPWSWKKPGALPPERADNTGDRGPPGDAVAAAMALIGDIVGGTTVLTPANAGDVARSCCCMLRAAAAAAAAAPFRCPATAKPGEPCAPWWLFRDCC